MEHFTNKTSLKRRVELINSLLNNHTFLVSLCTYSNNDISILLQNIIKIINYYLHSNDFVVTDNVSSLFSKINTSSFSSDKYSFYPTSSYLKKNIKINGLQSTSIHPPKFFLELSEIEKEISINKHNSKNNDEIYSDLPKALLTSLTYPNILFESILKYPKTEPQQYDKSEKAYYYSILQKRLSNIPEDTYATNARKAKKWFNAFVGEKPLLVVIPRNLTPKSNMIEKTISPLNLAYIELPTLYTLQNICSLNKPSLSLPEEQPKSKHYVYYSRFEHLPINSDFIYSNEEFTGDIDYDVDLIYGALDYNGTRKKISTSPYVNMQAIKNTYNIVVRKSHNKYEIKNGRHRLLYVKNYYVQNYDYYAQKGSLDFLKDLVTLIVTVDHFIEDDNVNNILAKLRNKYKAEFLKYNIMNDEPGIIIIIDNKAYAVKNILELTDFYNKISNSENIDSYFLSPHTSDSNYNYPSIIEYLIVTLKEQIYSMDLLDIINYLLTNGITISDKHYDIEELDYYALFNQYALLVNHINLLELRGLPVDIVEKTTRNSELRKIGRIIVDILLSNKEYLSLEWSEFVVILHKHPKLQDFDDKTLLEAANLSEYKKLKYEYFREENKSKPNKLW